MADGQCMMIVEQGRVVEVFAEPGEYTYDTSTEPSIFAGNLGESIKQTFKTVGKRFTYGGDTGKDQRVYYFNTKELLDNKFGTPNPVPFQVVDSKIGLDIDVSVRCSGVYSYKIQDPLLFYTNVADLCDHWRSDRLCCGQHYERTAETVRPNSGAVEYIAADSFSLNLSQDIFLYANTTRVPRNTNNRE